MSTIYSSSYLKTVGQYQNLNESRIFSARNDMQTSFDIFLSHSYLDKEIVKGLYRELTTMSFTVYVDWIIDPELDKGNVTKETATKIRNRLNMSKTLLLAISENAAVSKWMIEDANRYVMFDNWLKYDIKPSYQNINIY